MKHPIYFSFDQLPQVCSAGAITAEEPFLHQNRTFGCHVLICVHQGEMEVIEDGETYLVQAGECLLLRAGVHHWGERLIEAGTSWFYVHFLLPDPPKDWAPLMEGRMSVRQQEFIASDYRRYCPLPKLGPCPAGLLQREKQLLSFFQTSDPMRAAYCSAALYMLLADLLRVSRASRERNKAEVITSRLVTFLEENPNRAITAQEIEKWMRMSYKYLCGVFKENTGMSIHQYHTQLRIHEAARLLRETTLNISEIGYQVGYQDPLYFSHVFKRVKGCSPSEYARQPVQEP